MTCRFMSHIARMRTEHGRHRNVSRSSSRFRTGIPCFMTTARRFCFTISAVRKFIRGIRCSPPRATAGTHGLCRAACARMISTAEVLSRTSPSVCPTVRFSQVRPLSRDRGGALPISPPTMATHGSRPRFFPCRRRIPRSFSRRFGRMRAAFTCWCVPRIKRSSAPTPRISVRPGVRCTRSICPTTTAVLILSRLPKTASSFAVIP